MNKKLILITGCSRTGTTWTGRIIAKSPGLNYVYEPFNYDMRGRLRVRLGLPGRLCGNHQFNYIDEYNFRKYKTRLDRKIEEWKSQGESGALIKDPTAAFVARTLSNQYGAQTVVTVRHPIGVAVSRKKLGWHFNFNHFLKQKELMRILPSNATRAIEAALKANGDIISESAAMWCVIYSVLNQWIDESANWTVVRHEDLCADPVGTFRDLCQTLGLPFCENVLEAIKQESEASSTSRKQEPAKQHNHVRDSQQIPALTRKAISREEIDRVRAIAGETADAFYDASSWQ